MSDSSSDKPRGTGSSGAGQGAGAVPENWLVQGNAVASGALLGALAANHPDVRLLGRVASDILLVQMTTFRAEELKTQFATDLTVERDQSLDLFV